MQLLDAPKTKIPDAAAVDVDDDDAVVVQVVVHELSQRRLRTLFGIRSRTDIHELNVVSVAVVCGKALNASAS